MKIGIELITGRIVKVDGSDELFNKLLKDITLERLVRLDDEEQETYILPNKVVSLVLYKEAE